jgi:uncharacterized protein (DUF58 family)
VRLFLQTAHTELFRKIHHIELTAKQQVLDTFCGMYASIFKGQGIEMEDVREFQTGDDFRSINWAKTAQMGRPYVKNFREERDLTVMLVVDTSASTHFANKQERLAEVAALIAFSAIYNHDRVGLMLFSDDVEKMIYPKRGSRHGLRLIRDLLAYKPSGKGTGLSSALDHFNKVMRKRCICFLLSDFLAGSYEQQLGYAARKNDLIAIRVTDPLERDLPTLGLTVIQDVETGVKHIIDLNEEMRQQHREQWEKEEKEFQTIIAKIGAGSIEVDAKSAFVHQIITYFNKRKRQARI